MTGGGPGGAGAPGGPQPQPHPLGTPGSCHPPATGTAGNAAGNFISPFPSAWNRGGEVGK